MDGRFYSSLPWRRSRRAALRRAGHRCEAVTEYGSVRVRCPALKSLDVHHRVRPEDGGDRYALENLLVLCDSCHGRLHLTQPELVRARQRSRPKLPRLRPAAAAYRPFNPDAPEAADDLADPEFLARSPGWAA